MDHYAESKAEQWLNEWSSEPFTLRKSSLAQLIRIVQREAVETAARKLQELARDYYPDISDDDGV